MVSFVGSEGRCDDGVMKRSRRRGRGVVECENVHRNRECRAQMNLSQ
jgi:hypothetical protein